MPLFPMTTNKVLAVNEEKTIGVTFEFPPTMGYDEMLLRLNEIVDGVKRAKEAADEKAKADAVKSTDAKVEEVVKEVLL